MKEKNIFKTLINKKTVGMILSLLIIVIVIGIYSYNSRPKVTSTYINSVLSRSSELTSAKLNYKGITEYEDEGIRFINKGNFLMVYKATVRAGINVDEVRSEIDDKNKIIWLTIPKAEIQDVVVDPSSIKYYDEKMALFNFNEKEDANTAQVLVEKDAMKEAANMGVLELANKQSKELLVGILEDSIDKDYTFRFKTL